MLLMTYSSPFLDLKSLDLVPRPPDSLVFLLDFMGPCLMWHFEILPGLGSELSDGDSERKTDHSPILGSGKQLLLACG